LSISYFYDAGDNLWSYPRLLAYLDAACRDPINTDGIVTNARTFKAILTAQQYSAAASHFYAVEGEPTVLHPGPYQVEYVWISQITFEGSTITLRQDQRAKDVYTLTIKVT
jgi:hypothetical protein